MSIMRCKNANVFVHAPASFCGLPWRLWWMIDAMLVVADRMVTCGSKQRTELGQICHTPSEKMYPTTALANAFLNALQTSTLQLINCYRQTALWVNLWHAKIYTSYSVSFLHVHMWLWKIDYTYLSKAILKKIIIIARYSNLHHNLQNNRFLVNG